VGQFERFTPIFSSGMAIKRNPSRMEVRHAGGRCSANGATSAVLISIEDCFPDVGSGESLYWFKNNLNRTIRLYTNGNSVLLHDMLNLARRRSNLEGSRCYAKPKKLKLTRYDNRRRVDLSGMGA
jgi:hypothetical protein